jgi:HEAT repeat protein
MTQESVDIEGWIARIRSRDAMTFEDAFWGPRPTGPAVVPRLIAELQRATDSYTRAKLVELLGEMGDISAVPVLVAELAHPENEIRVWAVQALELLGFPDGLRAAQAYRQSHPEEFQ